MATNILFPTHKFYFLFLDMSVVVNIAPLAEKQIETEILNVHLLVDVTKVL